MARPMHLRTDGGGLACGATAKSKKTQHTDNREFVTCANCLRVINGNGGRRKGDGAEVFRKLRIEWAQKALTKAIKHVQAIPDPGEGIEQALGKLELVHEFFDKVVLQEPYDQDDDDTTE